MPAFVGSVFALVSSRNERLELARGDQLLHIGLDLPAGKIVAAISLFDLRGAAATGAFSGNCSIRDLLVNVVLALLFLYGLELVHTQLDRRPQVLCLKELGRSSRLDKYNSIFIRCDVFVLADLGFHIALEPLVLGPTSLGLFLFGPLALQVVDLLLGLGNRIGIRILNLFGLYIGFDLLFGLLCRHALADVVICGQLLGRSPAFGNGLIMLQLGALFRRKTLIGIRLGLLGLGFRGLVRYRGRFR